ncbi:two-component sensor histidine kinase [Microbispora rosea subsp. aerata]|nr:HAMP domain-containing sensor histidine kinase [Microbispora rosea]GGO06122.1 two-component sensor histidine kinase [Microbispora rosea subsp. aerata]GLJ82633.1 two-component sensor histidine kinase [Microbispora rosea subsp. aerata]
MSLRTRLLAGLLGVSAVLLVVLSLVSVLVLRGHLRTRLEGQVVAATVTAARRVVVGDPLEQALTGSTYALAVYNLSENRAHLAGGDAEDAAAVPGLTEALGKDKLLAYAAQGRTFDLDPSGRHELIAAAALSPSGLRLMVIAVPLDAVDDPVRHLLIYEMATGGVLMLLLAAGGRLLIAGGLAPLGKMARTAHLVAERVDLSARMPEGSSEVGRLGAAINLMLDRIGDAFRDRQASEDRVRRFAADASHELRTPLSTISGYAELYRAGAIPPEDLPKIMGRIEAEANRMGRLVGEMLELARLDRGAALALTETDLAEMAREVAADSAAVDPAYPVTVEAPPSLVATVDEARVRQVLVNLLGNVRAHTPEGTKATVRLLRSGDQVTIVVRDTGPGMSKEQAERAFDRFQRGEDHLSGGAGLGLSIVKAIVEAHGGRCRIDSSPGGGTAIHITLPAVQEATGG